MNRVSQAHAAGQAAYVVDIETVAGHYLGSGFYLSGSYAASENGKDIAVLALSSDPLFVFIVGNRSETYGDTEFRRLEEEFLHHTPGIIFINPHEYAHRQGRMDVSLAYVEDLGVVFRQYLHDISGQPGAVLARYAYQNLFVCHITVLLGLEPEWLSAILGAKIVLLARLS